MRFSYDIKKIEDVCEDMLNYDICEMFEGEVDNFQLACMMIRHNLLHKGDFNRTFLGVSLELVKFTPTVSDDEYERMINQCLQFDSFVWMMNDIRNSLQHVDYKDVEIDMTGARMVIMLT